MRLRFGEGARALLAGLGAAILFTVFWLPVGLPLGWSAGAALLAYGALWLMLKGGDKERDGAYEPFVDKPLAAKTAAAARAKAGALRSLLATSGGRPADRPRFERIASLLEAIASDVEADPKDAVAAKAFVEANGEAVLRIAKLALELESRGASAAQLSEARDRLDRNLDRLERAFNAHLASLQEDNLAELQAELDVLEESLEPDLPPESAPPAGPGDSSPGRGGRAAQR